MANRETIFHIVVYTMHFYQVVVLKLFQKYATETCCNIAWFYKSFLKSLYSMYFWNYLDNNETYGLDFR